MRIFSGFSGKSLFIQGFSFLSVYLVLAAFSSSVIGWFPEASFAGYHLLVGFGLVGQNLRSEMTMMAEEPSPIPSLSPTPSPSLKPSPSPSASPSSFLSPSPLPSPSLSPSPTPNISPSPSPSPSPVVKIPSPAELDSFFAKYSAEYGVDEGLLRQIAVCESGYNTQAVNEPYGGLYQFTASAWRKSRQAMGLDCNPQLRFDAEEAIKTAAFKIVHEGTAAWPNCSR